MVRAKFREVQTRRLLALEVESAQRNWNVASKIEENLVGHDVDEDVLIKRLTSRIKEKINFHYRTVRGHSMRRRSISS